jgi:thioredoxin 1
MRQIKTSDELGKVLKESETVIVDFYTTWCSPCQLITPFIENLASEFPHITVVKCDCENSEDITDTFGIKSIPTFIKFVKGRRETVVIGCDKTKILELFNGL